MMQAEWKKLRLALVLISTMTTGHPLLAGPQHPLDLQNNCSTPYKEKIREIDGKLNSPDLQLTDEERKQLSVQLGEWLYLAGVLDGAFLQEEKVLRPIQGLVAGADNRPLTMKKLSELLRLGSHTQYFCRHGDLLTLDEIVEALRGQDFHDNLKKANLLSESQLRALSFSPTFVQGAMLHSKGACKLPPHLQQNVSSMLGAPNPKKDIVEIMRKQVQKNPQVIEGLILALDLARMNDGGIFQETQKSKRTLQLDESDIQGSVPLYSQIFLDYIRDEGEVQGPLGTVSVDNTTLKKGALSDDEVVKTYYLALWRNLQADPYIQKEKSSLSIPKQREDFEQKLKKFINLGMGHTTQTFDQKMVSFFLNTFNWLLSAKNRKYHLRVDRGRIISETEQDLHFMDFDNVENKLPFVVKVRRKMVFDLLRENVGPQVFSFEVKK